MSNLLRKPLTLILSLLVLTLFVAALLFPSIGLLLVLGFLLLSLAIASLSIVERQKQAYDKGDITKIVFMRNISLEIIAILFAMLFAALLGNYIARIATREVDNGLIRFIAGIFIGFLVGIGVGIVVKQASEKLRRFFPKTEPE